MFSVVQDLVLRRHRQAASGREQKVDAGLVVTVLTESLERKSNKLTPESLICADIWPSDDESSLSRHAAEE